MPRRPTTIDEYLEAVPARRRTALEQLRRAVRAAAPEAEECISYGMPAFRVKGGVVGGFAATAQGCSYYPFSGSTLAALAEELGGYEQTRSALHFDERRPLPAGLVRKLVRARLEEIGSRAGAAGGGGRPRARSRRPAGAVRRGA